MGVTRRLLAKITSLNNNTVRYDYSDNTFTVTWPEFVLEFVMPKTVSTGAGTTHLTLHGSGFVAGDQVIFSHDTTTILVGPASIAPDQITVDFDFGATPRTWNVSVQEYENDLPFSHHRGSRG